MHEPVETTVFLSRRRRLKPAGKRLHPAAPAGTDAAISVRNPGPRASIRTKHTARSQTSVLAGLHHLDILRRLPLAYLQPGRPVYRASGSEGAKLSDAQTLWRRACGRRPWIGMG